GLATQALRAFGRPGLQVGITHNLAEVEPATDRAEDVEAAALLDGLRNRWYLDPVFRGSYPEDAQEIVQIPADLIQPGDMELISAPLDFLGVNYYAHARARANKSGGTMPETLRPTGKLTGMGWEIYPQGLTDILLRVHRDYQPRALYVT